MLRYGRFTVSGGLLLDSAESIRFPHLAKLQRSSGVEPVRNEIGRASCRERV